MGEFAWIQIPMFEPVYSGMKTMGSLILPDHLLHEEAVEKEPHITVLYGIHPGSDSEPSYKYLQGFSQLVKDRFPITVRELQVFANADYDVLSLRMESPKLMAWNKELLNILEYDNRLTQTYPEYKPHATIAILKPGFGQSYVEGLRNRLNGVTFQAEGSEYCEPDKEKRTHWFF